MLKNTVTRIFKMLFHELINRLDKAEEESSGLRIWQQKFPKMKSKEKERLEKKRTEYLRTVDNYKDITYMLGITRRRRKREEQNISSIWSSNDCEVPSKLMSDIKLQIQKPQRTHSMINNPSRKKKKKLLLDIACGASGKEPTCQRWRHKRHRFDRWVGKIRWRRTWQPTPVFLPGESHGQRSLGYGP